MSERGAERPLLVPALALAVLAISSAATFVRLADPLDAGVIAALRVGTTGLLLLLFSLGSTRDALLACRRDPALAARVLLSALMLGLHFGAWIASLTMTSVVSSVALVSTQPVFAGFLGRLVGDRAPRGLYVGAAVAIAGTAVMATANSQAPAGGDQMLLGDALALLGAVTAAVYLTIGRGVTHRLPLRGYLVLVNLLAGAMLVLFALATGLDWAPLAATDTDYLAVVYLGIVPGIVGHGLLNWAVRRVPVHVVSLTVLLEPLGAAAIAWLVLAETVTPLEGFGAAILLIGIALGVRARGGASVSPPAGR